MDEHGSNGRRGAAGGHRPHGRPAAHLRRKWLPRLYWILQNAAQPVLEQMLHNASTDPKRRTGTLLRSIKIGRVVKKRSGGYRVTVGIHRKDGGAAYGNPVEFGHGGPHPAPPHPFVRPAFDAKANEAYEKVKEQLKQALDSRGLL